MFIYIKSSENLCYIIYYILYIPKRKKYIKKEKGLKIVQGNKPHTILYSRFTFYKGESLV